MLVKSAKGSYKKYECRGEKDKTLSEKGYLFKIRPYLSNMINDHKATINGQLNVMENRGNRKFNYVCMQILFLLKIQEKPVLFMYGVIT